MHADLSLQTPNIGVKLMRYVQFHQEPKHVEQMKQLLEATGGNMQILPYDGCAEVYSRSAEDFIAFMRDVSWSERLSRCGNAVSGRSEGVSYHGWV